MKVNMGNFFNHTQYYLGSMLHGYYFSKHKMFLLALSLSIYLYLYGIISYKIILEYSTKIFFS